MKTKFYFCEKCGNLFVTTIDSGVKPHCCGEEMHELVAQTIANEAVGEKHVPKVTRVDDCTLRVEVGAMPHPMLKEHYIRFVYLETEHGGQLRRLEPDTPAVVEFCGCKDKPTAVYEYCNLHGLWVTDELPEAKKWCCCRKE